MPYYSISTPSTGNATQLQSRPISTAAPATGNSLVWDGSAWVPANGATGATGPAGADGAKVYHGAGAPSETFGNSGDLWVDTAGQRIYGPKANGAWGTPMNLAPGLPGPTGAAGAGSTGPTGAPGSQGQPGAAGASVTGATGARGVDGQVGSQGATGPTGARGVDGAAGSPGASVTGPTGPVGPASTVTGPAGAPGAGGVTSVNGVTGALTLAAVGGSWAVAGTTITLTVTGGGASTWSALTGKPFTSIGTGLAVDGSGVLSAAGLTSVSWGDITGKPATFAPSSHTHAISDTTGLQAALDGKAPIASPTFTGTVSGVTKAMVGLGSVDNVADASKPVSTAQAAADAVVQAYAIQRGNHTGTQAVGTITGLGGAATLSVGTTAGTVAAGDDSRITGALSAATASATYQPLDADLTSIAALTTTTFGRSLLTQADASATRTTIGLGSLATQNGTFSGSSSGSNTGDQTFALTGDVTGSGTGTFAATLSASGVTAGTYTSVTVDSKGRVTAGSSPAVAYSSLTGVPSTFAPAAHTQAFSTITATPTTLAGYGITDAAASSHTHGNMTNAGAIGSTSGQIVVTTTSGVLTTAATISASAVSGLAAVATSGSGSDITTGTVAAARLGTHASTHQTGGSDAVTSVVVTPTSLAADVNDWAIGTGDVFRVAGTAARNVTGIVAGTSGLAILLVNVGSFALTLKHQSASSTAANRFTTPLAGDCILAAAGGNAVLVYDSTTATWRVL